MVTLFVIRAEAVIQASASRAEAVKIVGLRTSLAVTMHGYKATSTVTQTRGCRSGTVSIRSQKNVPSLTGYSFNTHPPFFKTIFGTSSAEIQKSATLKF